MLNREGVDGPGPVWEAAEQGQSGVDVVRLECGRQRKWPVQGWLEWASRLRMVKSFSQEGSGWCTLQTGHLEGRGVAA